MPPIFIILDIEVANKPKGLCITVNVYVTMNITVNVYVTMVTMKYLTLHSSMNKILLNYLTVDHLLST